MAPVRGLDLGILVTLTVGCLLELGCVGIQVGHRTRCKNPDSIGRWSFALSTMDFFVIVNDVVDWLQRDAGCVFELVMGPDAMRIVSPAGFFSTLGLVR